MLEKTVEAYLVRRVRQDGGEAFKLNSVGSAGLPDRLVLLPKGLAVFVELKAPGQAPRPLQICQMGKLKKLGQRVEVLDSKEQVNQLLDALLANGGTPK